MEVLIVKLKFVQKLHVNHLIAWAIRKKKYEKVYFLININKKI